MASPQRKAISNSPGMAPEPSFIFSSGMPIKDTQGFLKITEYQRPPSRKMARPLTRMAR